MKQIQPISDAEWQVMKVLWSKSPVASSEVIETLRPITKWNPKTIHTLISRLVKKGAVEAKKHGAFYLYSVLVSEEECQRAETKSFIERVYDGSLHLLVANFLKDEKLTSEEIKEIKNMLNKMDD